MKNVLSITVTLLLLTIALPAGWAAEGTSATIQGDWWAKAQRQIEASEYQITWKAVTPFADLDAAWQAPNRAQGFRTYFAPRGIRVVPRVETTVDWEWSLTLLAGDPPADGEAAPEARPTVSGNRVEFDRGAIREWYVNDDRGLEQGFTLDSSPSHSSASRAGGAAHVDLVLGGTLRPRYSEDGQAIDFLAPDGLPVIHYGSLVVKDDLGRVLSAWMSPFSEAGLSGVRITFDDGGAVYPVTIDSLATSAAWSVEGTTNTYYAARAGFSVGTAGDVNNDGYADIVFGAPHETHASNGNLDGDAHVYFGSAAANFPTDWWGGAQLHARAGYSVATAGDVDNDGYDDIVVGLPYADEWTASAVEVGEVAVYYGGASGIDTSRSPVYLRNSDTEGYQHFGWSVSPAGDVNGDGYADIVVGAPGNAGDVGAAVVYYGSASGLGSPTTRYGSGYCELGYAVAGGGDVNGDGYGDVLVGEAAGIHSCSDTGGRAMIFLGSATGLAASPSWQSNGSDTGTTLNYSYGTSVAMAGDVNGDGYADWIVGARSAYNPSLYINYAGGAFVYHGASSVAGRTPVWSAYGPHANSNFGYSVATAGDTNGDGLADILIGVPGWNTTVTGGGGVVAYAGTGSGLQSWTYWTVQSGEAGSKFGAAVATAGDVNGDGYSDVIVGAYGHSSDRGQVFVYLGSREGMKSAAAWDTGVSQVGMHLGYSAAMGDVNGDGFADVAAGAPDYDLGSADVGAVFVWHGSAVTPSATASWAAYGTQAAEQFGAAIAMGGDVNGDGYVDLVVGAPHHVLPVQTDNGMAQIYNGSASGLPAFASWTVYGSSGAQLGTAVANSGDVNGDGYADVLVGVPAAGNGAAVVYTGSASGPSTTPTWTLNRTQSGPASARRWLRPGRERRRHFDIVVGSPQYDISGIGRPYLNAGRVDLWYGSRSGLTASSNWFFRFFMGGAFAQLGAAVGTAGDVNGDGYSDIIVGAPYLSYDNVEDGHAYLFYGWSAGLRRTRTTTRAPGRATRISARRSAAPAISTATAGRRRSPAPPATTTRCPGRAGCTSIPAAAAALVFSGTQRLLLRRGGGGRRRREWRRRAGPPRRRVSPPRAGLGQRSRLPLLRRIAAPGHPAAAEADERRRTIAPLGVSDVANGYRMALTFRNPLGRSKVKIERETRVFRIPFSAPVSRSSTWYDAGLAGIGVDERPPGSLARGAPSTGGRARLLFDHPAPEARSLAHGARELVQRDDVPHALHGYGAEQHAEPVGDEGGRDDREPLVDRRHRRAVVRRRRGGRGDPRGERRGLLTQATSFCIASHTTATSVNDVGTVPSRLCLLVPRAPGELRGGRDVRRRDPDGAPRQRDQRGIEPLPLTAALAAGRARPRGPPLPPRCTFARDVGPAREVHSFPGAGCGARGRERANWRDPHRGRAGGSHPRWLAPGSRKDEDPSSCAPRPSPPRSRPEPLSGAVP